MQQFIELIQTHPDVVGLVIMAFCIVLFVTHKLPMAVTGCLGCLLMVLLGVCDFETAFSGFSDSIVLLMAGSMIVGISMTETGLSHLIGRTVVRWAGNNERVFLLVTCAVAGLLAMFLANTAVLAMFIPLIDGICRVSPAMKQRNLTFPVGCAVMFGGACTLIGCTPQLTANALLSRMSGIQMGMWSLTGPAICLFALFLLYAFFIGYGRGKKIWGGRPQAHMVADEDAWTPGTKELYNKRKLITMVIVMVLMLISFIFELFSAPITVICAAIICVISGCCSVKTVVEELHWENIVFLATCLGVANAITQAGSGELIGKGLSFLLGDLHAPFPIFAILVLFTLLLSQFITNSSAIMVVLPSALSLCTAYGFSPMPFCIGITLAASLACCTPLAASQIAMTQVAGYDFGDYFRYAFPLTVLAFGGILLVVPLFYPLA